MISRRLNEPVTKERTERVLVALFYMMVRHDAPWASPIFDRVERELETMNAGQDPLSRAC
jgi:hypothetical protein